MKKIMCLLLSLLIALSVAGCGSDSKPTATPVSPTTSTPTSVKTPEQLAKEKADAEAAQVAKNTANADAKASLVPDDISKFKDYTKGLKGASFIKSAELTGDSATIIYVSNHAENKSLNPNSTISESDYRNYWETGDAINKTLMDIPVRLMRQFSAINKVVVVLPFENKQYSVSLDRTTVEKYFNFSLRDLQLQETWTNQFVNRYEYNKEERAKFAEKFIRVQ